MKNARQTVFSVLLLFIVHAVLCVLYNFTYFSESFNFDEKFGGVAYWVILIAFFLAGPLFYYIAGRLRTGKGNKKATVISAFICNAALVIFGLVAFKIPGISAVYMHINAPSYLYYSLFADSVRYIAIPAMIISGMFPSLFFKMGYEKKPRTNNQLNMDEVEKIRNGEDE